MNTEPSEREEAPERLKQIRERWGRMNMPQTVFTAHCKGDIDFLFSLLDGQSKLAHELALIVDVGTSDDPGTAITKIRRLQGEAATQMRERCVSRVKEVAEEWRREVSDPTRMIKYDAARALLTELQYVRLEANSAKDSEGEGQS